MSGLRSCIYRVPDLGAARDWYSEVFEATPYFVEEYYVGFDIGGYELGLLPDSASGREINLSGLSYWDTPDITESLEKFRAAGGKIIEDIQDVGDGVKLAAVSDLWNNAVGLIENRFFRIGDKSVQPDAPRNPGVTALGGIFFKSSDPKALKNWYEEHLGIISGKYGSEWQWRKEKPGNGPGFTVWSPFESSTSYFDPSEHSFMINYRVNDLEALLVRLEENNISQVGQMEVHEYGKFAWILDPEGHKIELWEPVDSEYAKMDSNRMAAE